MKEMKSKFLHIKTVFCLLICIFWGLSVSAQEAQPEMADVMRSNGKIYVVVLVLATIFAGIIIYLISLDKKISKLEKNK